MTMSFYLFVASPPDAVTVDDDNEDHVNEWKVRASQFTLPHTTEAIIVVTFFARQGLL